MIFNIVVDLYSFKNNNNSKVMFIDLGTSRCNQSNLLKLYYCIKLLIDLGFFEKFYTPTLQCTPVIRTPFITTTSIQQHFLWERKHKCYFLIILLPLQRHQLPLQQQFETPKNVTPRSKCTTRATCIHILEENKNCTPSKTQEFIHYSQQHQQQQQREEKGLVGEQREMQKSTLLNQYRRGKKAKWMHFKIKGALVIC
eukprot:TRINITY_DN1552_c0_g1_i6.p1 TRINITY_DN1552_c0_g1~~TRINITY_DN1552_c0_g1_i6.p1  ORF type:complete len:198 (+),score=-9.22 TRINITY_DN1552_c0_g1_i6:1116-1709(+)